MQVSVNEPLLTDNQMKETNLMSVTIESLYSPPEGWQTGSPAYHYTVCLPVPSAADVSTLLQPNVLKLATNCSSYSVVIMR